MSASLNPNGILIPYFEIERIEVLARWNAVILIIAADPEYVLCGKDCGDSVKQLATASVTWYNDGSQDRTHSPYGFRVVPGLSRRGRTFHAGLWVLRVEICSHLLI